MKDFILPEKWHINATNDEEDDLVVDYINRTFNQKINPGLSNSMLEKGGWWYSNYSFNGDYSSKNDEFYKNLSVQITFDQFKQYVIKIEPIFEEFVQDEEYNNILIKLLNNDKL